MAHYNTGMNQVNSELEKVLGKANEFLVGISNLDPEEALHRAGKVVFSRNSYYGNLLLNMGYIYLRKNRFVKNGKDSIRPRDAIMQYIARKILTQQDRKIFKAIHIDDDICSARSAGLAMSRLASEYGALEHYRVNHAYHSYVLKDKWKLEQIAEGNFT